MACCKPCCGCQDCAEGQQGKCCCGGSSGTCCQAGEYCCSGVCQNSPCEGGGACCLPDGTCVDGLTQAECELCPQWCVYEGQNFRLAPDNDCAQCPEVDEDDGTALVGCGDSVCFTPTGPILMQNPCSEPPGTCSHCLECWVYDGNPATPPPGTPFGGTWHPGQTCADNPCETCFERALLGDEAYVDGWCANAASSAGFAGAPCEFTTATCGTRTLVTDYGGFGDWMVTVCCDNPLP